MQEFAVPEALPCGSVKRHTFCEMVHLFEPAVRHHLVHAPVDALIQILAGALQPEYGNLPDTALAFLLPVRKLATRSLPHFQYADDALGILRLNTFHRFRVHL